MASLKVGIRSPLTYVDRLVDGLAATGGLQYSPVATVGTTAVDVFTKLITPVADLALKEVQVILTAEFNNLMTDSVASLAYCWYVRRESIATTDNYHAITEVYTRGIPTSGVAGDPVEETFFGYVPVGTLTVAPFRIRLRAQGLLPNAFTGRVKSNSLVRVVGTVIPGT